MKKRIFAFALCLFSPAAGDTLQPLGDEFNDAATLARWKDLDVVEGWVASTHESADINTTTPGRFRIVPIAWGWYMHVRGALFFKEVTGDFIATTRLRVFSRHNAANPMEVPNRSFSLTGIFVHEPRPFITHAAPVPYRTDAVWPPAAYGSDYVPNTENYIFLSFGSAGNPGTRQFEIKATRNSDSRLYFNTTGLDQASNEVWVQMVRVGNTVVCLRKHSEAGPWLVENRYPNPDHPFPAFGPTLQVGLTAYTDWPNWEPSSNGGVQTSFHANYAPPGPGQPDLISEVDYFRLKRPPAALTEAVLQAMIVSYNPATHQSSNPPVQLSTSAAAAPHLGENASIPLGLISLSAPAFSASESDGSITVTVRRSGVSLDQPLSVQYQTSPGTASAADFTAASGTLTWAANDPLEKTVLIPLSNDHLAEGDETLSLVLDTLDGPATFPASVSTVTAALTIHDHPFDQWRVDRFGLTAAQTAAGAPNADPDGDGLDNLTEYALGSNPLTSSDSPALPAVAIESGIAILRFTPSPVTPGVALTVQFSNDIGSWTPLATRASGTSTWTVETPGTVIEEAGGTVSISLPHQNTTRAFCRLRSVVD
jgi:hypothetical protein